MSTIEITLPRKRGAGEASTGNPSAGDQSTPVARGAESDEPG